MEQIRQLNALSVNVKNYSIFMTMETKIGRFLRRNRLFSSESTI